MMLLGNCWRRNCELINGRGNLNTISFSVAVVAVMLHHVTVAVATDTGTVP
jgi:hypothetical protein